MTDPQPPLEFEDVLALAGRLGPLASFASVDDDGTPHVVPVIPVWSHGLLVFAAHAASRKVRNLRQRHRVSVQFLTPGETFPDALLIKGAARVVHDDAERSAHWSSGAMPWLPAMYPGPTDAGLRFVEVTPSSAVVVRGGGRGPVQRWRGPDPDTSRGSDAVRAAGLAGARAGV